MANLGGGATTLPTEFDVGQRPTAEGEQAVVQDRSGQIIGGAVADFGSNLVQIGSKIADEQDRLQMAQARSSYLQADVAAREIVKNTTDWQSAVPTYQKTMQQAQQNALGMVKNNINRKALQIDLQNDYATGSSQVLGVANTMRQNANQATMYSTLDANRQAALLAPDDATRVSLINSSLDTINAAQQARTITPLQAEEIRKNYTSSLDKGFIEMQPLQKQIDIINQSLKPHEGRLPGDYIQPDDRYNMLQRAEAKLKEGNSGAVADMKSHITSLDAAYHAGLPVDPKYALTKDQIEAVMPGQGQTIYDSLMRSQRVGNTVKNINQMTPAQLQQVQRQYKVTVGGVDTDDKLMRENEINQAINQSIAARNADPAKFAVDNGLGYKQINFDDQNAMLQELGNRATNQVSISQKIGKATPMLSAPEAKQFNTLLMSQTPDKRAQLLGSINMSLHNGDAYQSLMKQVMPQSPVTAIVGSRIGLNNPTQPPTWFDHTALPPQETAQTILRGEEILTGKTEEKAGYKKNFPMPSDAGYGGMRATFQRGVGDMFQSRADTADATFAAYKAAYAGLAERAGHLATERADPDISRQALAMAVGNQINWQGHTIAVPDGMKPDSFKSYVNSAVEAAAKAYGGPADWKDRIKGYQLQEIGAVGSGRYKLVNGNATLARPDGKGSFIIDLRQQFGQQ